MKPNYEKPIDTAEDILDRGLTIIPNPGTGSIVEALKSSPFEITRKLAERTTVPKVIVLHIKNFHFNILFPKRIGLSMLSLSKIKLSGEARLFSKLVS